MSIRETIIDKWSAWSHKQPMKSDARSVVETRMSGWAPSSWTGEENARRLTSYTIAAAYDQNVSRDFLATLDQSDRDERREYGDAALIIDQIEAHLLGETQEVTVAGADDYDPELDEDAPAADAPAPVDEPTPEDRAANNAARELAERQDFLRTWADDVHLPLRMVDCERNAVGLGDGVYLTGWDDEKQRPVPAVMDPGFYFPVLPDTLDAYEYPTRVHFAWELPAEDFPDRKQRVRRITYQIRDLAPIIPVVEDGMAPPEESEWILPADSSWQNVTEGGIRYRQLVRQYPWDEAPSRKVCTVTDATWILDDLDDASNPDAFSYEAAEIHVDDQGREVFDLDLLIDFLPIVHVPNTPPGGDHFGQSSLARVAQLLDDIQNADTDAQAASATTGSPIVGVSGSATGGTDPLTGDRGTPMVVKPGAVWRFGVDGRMDVLDTSANLAATREYVEHLRNRLAVNSRLPAAVLGMLKPSEVPSGFAMQLSFGPLTSMIRVMRLVRAVKYALLLKQVQRLYQANGVLPAGATPRAEVTLGAYLPSDMPGTLAAVKDAYGAKIISLETAVAMLLEVGFPIDDVAEEIQRIQARDFEGANALADATGDQDQVGEYLGKPTVPVEEPDPTQVAPIIPPASAGAGAGGA